MIARLVCEINVTVECTKRELGHRRDREVHSITETLSVNIR